MKVSYTLRNIAAAVLLIAGISLMILSLGHLGVSDTGKSAARIAGKRIDKKLDKLDTYIVRALSQDPSEWLDLGELPEDMVVYRYCSDTLQSWCNEFPLSNDNIKSFSYIPFIANPRIPILSPLADVSEDPVYINMGLGGYIVKAVQQGDVKIIAGIEISNLALNLGQEYSIKELSNDGGAVVRVHDRPLFKINYELLTKRSNVDSGMLFAAMIFIAVAALLFLSTKKSVARLKLTLLVSFIVMLAGYLIGRNIRDSFEVFSPMFYAGNELLYSLGAVVIINLLILVFALCIYMARRDICASLKTRRSRTLFFGIETITIIGIIAYGFITLSSILLNSSGAIGLYKLSSLNLFSIAVYASFLTMFMSIPLLLQTAQPLIVEGYGKKYDALSLGARIVFSTLISALLVISSVTLSLDKEQKRMEVLANRLSFDRDISLELYLRSIEGQIANDMVISALSVFNNTGNTIQSRIRDSYFARNERNYTLSVYVFNPSNNTRAAASQYNSLLNDAEPIADNSRFSYVKRDNGHSYYIGVFMYLVEGSGVSRVLIRLDSRDTRNTKGYAGIFGISPPGKVTLPKGYSYARYENGDLTNYIGNFAYPTRISDFSSASLSEYGLGREISDGYLHYLTVVNDGELAIISRPQVSFLDYLVMVLVLAIVSFLILSILVIGRDKHLTFERSYFRNRLEAVLLISLVATLILIAGVSVFFVYSRNDINMRTIMSDKISSITSMIDAGLTDVQNIRNLDRRTFRDLLERVGNDTNSDISFYTMDGKMLMSTAPMVFERMILGDRLNGKAYGEIVYKNNRYVILKENVGGVHFYSMYAPIFDGNGSQIGIICSPYNEDTFDFEEEAVTHSMTIISLFIVLLLLAMLTVTRIVDRIFKPLIEMSEKIAISDVESLEYIEYDRDDEVSSIVNAYNRMVTELSESTRQLAQAERDKAWSGMARQVAHEIKNPLTPMKLQLQRVIRLKQKNDPSWQERFDEASKVLLDHIDILTDTANEFSTFAKLYTEEASDIVLDKLLKEEIAMFDNKENIQFDYIGLDDIHILGPKPQLTRVFVNLLNNAVQAIEDKEDGRIMVSLRNSNEAGYYDIVFEDNGEGVSEENVSKLFTPNFTTKSAGSGLGLAISRSILERCGAKIHYQRSFALGGACFVIHYPIAE